MAERMNPNVKALWLTALRSGEYKRGTGVLHRFDGCMCPLGVLADVAARNGCPVSVQQTSSGDWSYDGQKGMVPDKILDWAGIDPDYALEYEGVGHSIPYLNDDADLSFAQIAELIEEQL